MSEYTLPDGMGGESGTTIYIPLHNVNTVSFDVAKAYYSAWYIYDDKDNTLQANTGRNTTTVNCSFNVTEYEYIKLTNSNNGSGATNFTIYNFKAY